MEFDVFISHASDDKDYVEPLATSLKAAGIKVWYDAATLEWGDNLRYEIDRGLLKSRFAIVVLSKAFLRRKKWTEYELDSLFALESVDRRVILPIWHGITREDVLAYGPGFADRLAKVSTSDSHQDIVDSLLKKLQKPEGASDIPSAREPSSRELLKTRIDHSRPNQKTLRKFQKLLDIIDDADLMNSDREFAGNGGKINYIFDENLFEAFIEPRRYENYGSLFYGEGFEDGWDDTAVGGRYSSQLTLLAVEQLFSGTLPGQVARKSYLSKGHSFELNHRVSHISKEKLFRERRVPPLAHRYLYRLAQVHAWQMSDEEGQLVSMARHVDQTIVRDADEMLASGASPADVRKYVTTRILVQLLSEDEDIVPLLQQCRLYSDAFLPALTPLMELWSPSASEISQLKQESEQWSCMLMAELEASGGARPHLALQNDADTLAQAICASRDREAHGERTVFVTGDMVIYNAYRRWFTRNATDSPFLIRRVKQYGPLFSAEETRQREGNDLLSLKISVSSALRDFNIKVDRQGEEESSRWARRALSCLIDDYLTPRRPDEAKARAESVLMMFVPSDEWLHTYKQLFDDMLPLWRNAERALIGANAALLDAHLSLSDLGVLDMEGNDEAVKTAVYSWVETILEQISAGSVRFSLPVAREMIASADLFAGRMKRVGQPRPFMLRLAPIGEANADCQAVDIELVLSRNRNSERGRVSTVADLLTRDEKLLLQAPEVSFALAATISIYLGRWMEAERFAEFAFSCARKALRGARERAEEAGFLEYVYLNALATRARTMNSSYADMSDFSGDEVSIRSWSGIMNDIAPTLGDQFLGLRAAYEAASALLTHFKIEFIRRDLTQESVSGLFRRLIFHILRTFLSVAERAHQCSKSDLSGAERSANSAIEEDAIAIIALCRVLQRALDLLPDEEPERFERHLERAISRAEDLYDQLDFTSLNGPLRGYIILHEHVCSRGYRGDEAFSEAVEQALKETYARLDLDFGEALRARPGI